MPGKRDRATACQCVQAGIPTGCIRSGSSCGFIQRTACLRDALADNSGCAGPAGRFVVVAGCTRWCALRRCRQRRNLAAQGVGAGVDWVAVGMLHRVAGCPPTVRTGSGVEGGGRCGRILPRVVNCLAERRSARTVAGAAVRRCGCASCRVLRSVLRCTGDLACRCSPDGVCHHVGQLVAHRGEVPRLVPPTPRKLAT